MPDMVSAPPRPRGFDRILPTLKRYSYPQVVVVETINRCNLNCVMCPQSELTRPVGEMREALFRKIVDDIAAYSPDQTELWLAIMGEVLLLGERALDYIQYAVASGIRSVNLNTNLMPADDAMCRRLVRTGLSKIIVGVDAATRETYARIRRGGDFDRLGRNIASLLDEAAALGTGRPEIVLQYIVQDGNRDEVQAFIDRYRGSGAILKIRQRLGWGTGVEAPDLDLPAESRDYPCPWLNRSISVHVTGQVAQCDAAWNGIWYHGDLNYQTITEAWNGPLLRLRERHWALDFSFEPCKDCRDWQCGRAELIT